MLPERIGVARAREIQLLNRHITPDAAVAYGIAPEAVASERIDCVIGGWIAKLNTNATGSVRATRELLMPPERRAEIENKLVRERERFLDQIESDEADAAMAKFLAVA
jgi:enoyl-CoA hydratase/carnithine racemase